MIINALCKKEICIFCNFLEGWFYNCYIIYKVSVIEKLPFNEGMSHTYHSLRNKVTIDIIMIYVLKKYI